jgi:hypothetical protein
VSKEVAEDGAHVNGEETGQTVVGGECAGEGMGGTRNLTSGPGLPVGERRERERGGAADRWGRAVRHGCGRERCWAAWATGGEGGGGGKRARAWLGSETAQPMGGRGFPFVFFYFLFHISIFYFYFFLFPFVLNQQFAK